METISNISDYSTTSGYGQAPPLENETNWTAVVIGLIFIASHIYFFSIAKKTGWKAFWIILASFSAAGIASEIIAKKSLTDYFNSDESE